MIRHHDAQDALSAEAAPMLLASSLDSTAHAASLQGHATVQSGSHGHYGTPWNHTFGYYAAPLSTLLLIVASAAALLMLMKAAATRLNSGKSAKISGSVFFIKPGRRGYTISRRQ